MLSSVREEPQSEAMEYVKQTMLVPKTPVNSASLVVDPAETRSLVDYDTESSISEAGDPTISAMNQTKFGRRWWGWFSRSTEGLELSKQYSTTTNGAEPRVPKPLRSGNRGSKSRFLGKTPSLGKLWFDFSSKRSRNKANIFSSTKP